MELTFRQFIKNSKFKLLKNYKIVKNFKSKN